jgi:uncharacterized Zn finger protein (UPF0148 family)
MSEHTCPRCGRQVNADAGAAFCPYCGGTLAAASADKENEAVQAVLKQVSAQTDPEKKHTLLVKAQAEYPNSLAIAEEQLLLGRLYQRNARRLDFSVIKSYLLTLYLEPETLSPQARDGMRQELFHHADLDRCLALAPDQTAFLSHYLTRMSAQFIELFLRGNNLYMHRFFGFGLEGHASKYLAAPVARMLKAMSADTELTGEQRALLMHAFYAAFTQQIGEETRWLEEAMAEVGVKLE